MENRWNAGAVVFPLLLTIIGLSTHVEAFPRVNSVNLTFASNSSQIASIAIGSDGYSYVTGHFAGYVDFGPGIGTLYSAPIPGWDPPYPGTDVFIAKMAADGSYVWVRHFVGTGGERATSIVLDGVGGVYVCGLTSQDATLSGAQWFDFAAQFGSPEPLPSSFMTINTTVIETPPGSYQSAGPKAFWTKYTTGGDFVWVFTSSYYQDPGAPQPMPAYVNDLAYDSFTNTLWSVGHFATSGAQPTYPATGFNGVFPPQTGQGFAEINGFLLNINPTTGEVRSLVQSGNFDQSSSLETGNVVKPVAVAVTSDGNVWVVGSFAIFAQFQQSTLGSYTTFTTPNSGVFQGFLVKYSPAGAALFAIPTAGGAQINELVDVAIDASDNVFVAGSTGASSRFGDFALNTTTIFGRGVFVARVTNPAVGDPKVSWVYTGRALYDSAPFSQSLAFDANGFIYAGIFWSEPNMTFGYDTSHPVEFRMGSSGALLGVSREDIFMSVVKLDIFGRVGWISRDGPVTNLFNPTVAPDSLLTTYAPTLCLYQGVLDYSNPFNGNTAAIAIAPDGRIRIASGFRGAALTGIGKFGTLTQTFPVTVTTSPFVHPSVSQLMLITMEDVNDCVTNNGGCGLAICLYGSLSGCGPSVISSTIRSPTPGVIQFNASVLILPNTKGDYQMIQFTAVYSDFPPTTFTYRYGRIGGPASDDIPCKSLTYSGVTGTVTVNCTIGPGLGRDFVFSLYSPDGVRLRTYTDRFSYPPPVIGNSTIRLGAAPISVNYLTLIDQSIQTIALNVSNMVADDQRLSQFVVRVWYGNTTHPTTYECRNVRTTYDTVRCDTELNAVGLGLTFSLTAGGQWNVGANDNVLNYAQVPVVTAVSGCTTGSRPAETVDCNTAGGVPIFVSGTNFVLSSPTDPLQVLIGGATCGSVTLINSQTMRCVLGAGTGKSLSVVVRSGFQFSQISAALLSYRSPTLTSVLGCTPDVALSIKDCPRSRGVKNVTLTGTDFGAGASVVVGTSPCFPVTYLGPNTVTCPIPAGSEKQTTIVLFQQTGAFAQPFGFLGYVQCNNGSIQVDRNPECKPCDAGSSSDRDGSSNCDICQAGFGSLGRGANRCAECDVGLFSAGSNQTCTECPAGRSTRAQRSGECVECAPGRYQPQSGKFDCLDCPLGKFSNVTGATDCKFAPPGYFASCGPPAYLGAAGCQIDPKPCPVGTNSTGGRGRCDDCLEGFYQDQPAQTSCEICGLGQTTSKGTAGPCTPCPAGRFGNPAAGIGACKQCDPGSISNPGASVCTVCEAGKSTNAVTTGAVACVECSQGFYAPRNSPECLLCGPGQSNSGDRSENCTLCLPGWYTATTLAGRPCTRASQGFFVPLSDRTQQRECPIGTFSQDLGSTGCTPCPIGTFAPSPRSIECIPCGLGTAQPSPGANSSCIQCEPGTVQPGTKKGTCIECDPGTYQPGRGQSECLKCPRGLYSTRGATECTRCPPGQYQGDEGGAQCYECGEGFASGPGTLSAGSTACFACLPGSYAKGVANANCTLCGINTYSANGQAPDCTRCKSSEFAKTPGSTKCTGCDAGAGVYYSIAKDDCVPCPTGTVCNPEVAALDNFFVLQDPRSSEVTSYQCLTGYCKQGDACANVGANTTDSNAKASCCADNRIPADQGNLLCAQCLPGHTDWGGECIKCEEANAGMIFLLVVVSWIYVIIFHVLAQYIFPEWHIFLNFVQMIVLYMGSELPSLAILNLFFFNPFSIAFGTCVSPFGPMQRVFLGLIMSLLVFAQSLVTCAISSLLSKLALSGKLSERATGWFTQEIFQPSTFIRTFVSLGLFTYATIANTAITYFDCREINGITVMSRFPAVECDSPDYVRLIPVIYAALVGVVAGIPAIIIGLLLYMFFTGRLGMDPNFTRRFGTLYENYRHAPEMKALLWEVVVLMRRVAVITISLLLSTDRAQKFTALALANLVFLAGHITVEPYIEYRDNLAETFSFIILALLTAVLATAPAPLPLGQNIAFNLVVYVTAFLLLVRTYWAARKGPVRNRARGSTASGGSVAKAKTRL